MVEQVEPESTRRTEALEESILQAAKVVSARGHAFYGTDH